MSIIAEALKKAQKRQREKVSGAPPFDLSGRKETEVKEPAAQAAPASIPRAKPVSATAVVDPKVPVIPKAKPVGAAPKAKPVQAEPSGPVKPQKTKKKSGRRFSILVPVVVTVFLVLVAGVVFYVNKVYLPGLQSGGMQAQGPPPVMQQPVPAAEAPGETPDAEQISAGSVQAVEEETAVPDIDVPAVGEIPAPPKVELAENAVSAEAAQKPTGGNGRTDENRAPAASITPPTESSGEVVADMDIGNVEPLDETSVPESEARQEITSKGEVSDIQMREDIYHFNMAVFFQRQGNYEAALDEYEKVIELSPQNAEVFCNIGAIYSELGETQKAVAYLQRSLLIDPNYPKARNNLGLAYYDSGQYEMAIDQFRRAIAADPTNLESYNNLGLVYKKLERYDEAEAAFESALKIDPLFAPGNYNLAIMCEDNGRYDMAIEHYTNYLRSPGASPELAPKIKERLDQLTGNKSQPQN